jgi:tetratricopeptide (TPR) repeat protein
MTPSTVDVPQNRCPPISHRSRASVNDDSLRLIPVPVGYCLAVVLVAASWSCSSSQEQQFAQHVERGDRYAEQHKYHEAVIEYRNAARAAPNDVPTHWKLAQAAIAIKDVPTAFTELHRITTLDPAHYDASETLGQMYLAAGKVQEAGRIAEHLIAAHGRRPAGYVLRARLAAQEGNLAAAITQFEEAVQRDPTMDAIMVALGHLYLLQQNLAQALAWYERALNTRPDSVEAHMARGNYYVVAGRRGDADKDFDQAASLGKGSEDTRLAIAIQHLRQGRPFRAEQEFTAVAADTNSRKARQLLTELKLELGKLEEAKELLNVILQEDRQNLATIFLQGRVALAEQRYTDARSLFEDVMKRDAAMASAHLYLGLVDLVDGSRSAGEGHIHEAIKLDPDNPKAHLVLAEFYLNENSFAKAEQEAFEVLRRNPAHVQAAVLYADSFLLRDEWDKAEAVYSALLTQLPENPIGPAKMALLKQRQGFTSQAATLWGEAVKRSPADHGLMSEYLLALLAGGRQDRAGRLLKEYLDRAPGDSVRWEVAGRFHAAARHPDQAEKAFQKAAELAPLDPRPAYQLAQFYIARNHPAAEAALRTVLSRDETYEAAHTSLGLLLASRGKTDEANAHYRRALDLKPADYIAANNLAASLADQDESLDEALHYGRLALAAAPRVPAVQDTVGWIYFKKGSVEEAYPLLSAAAGGLGDNPTVRYHHAMALARRGERASATAELEAALSLSKNFPGASEATATLALLRE